MGIPVATTMTPPAGDLANAVVTGALASTGTSSLFAVYGAFNLAIWGTFNGSVTLSKTYDAGSNWIPVSTNGAAVYLTAPVTMVLSEVERGCVYRLDATVNSGTINYRFSTTGLMAQSIGA